MVQLLLVMLKISYLKLEQKKAYPKRFFFSRCVCVFYFSAISKMLEYNVMMLCLLSNQMIIITLTELLPFNVFFNLGLIARQASLNTLLFCC